MKKNKKTFLVNGATHFGHKSFQEISKQSCHPSMAPFLLGNKKTTSVIHLDITLHFFFKALSIITCIALSGGHICIINTNSENVSILKTFLKKIRNKKNISYCNSKWIGGTLTNWKQISTSVQTFGVFSKKFKQFLSTNNIYFPRYKKLKNSFQGLVQFTRFGVELSFQESPDLLIVVNPNENKTVLKEAVCLNIPVIAITDSNTDLSCITYPIPGNSNSFSFIFFYFSWIVRILNILQKRKM